MPVTNSLTELHNTANDRIVHGDHTVILESVTAFAQSNLPFDSQLYKQIFSESHLKGALCSF